MLEGIKKYIRKNKILFSIARFIYVPIKELILYVPKKKCKEEAMALLTGRDESKPTIFFFGVPVHMNLGDLAQTLCILKYFEKYWDDYEVLAMRTYSTYSTGYIRKLKSKIRPQDIIFFQSGYCTTDRHLDHTMHKIMLKEFPNNKIVFFPQTVLFRDKKEQERTCKIFNKHNKVLFIARDKVSYDYAKELFPALEVECFPDIVTTLIGTRECRENRDGILLCLRDDFEKLYSDDEMKLLKNELQKNGIKVDVTDTNYDENTYEYLVTHLEECIINKIEEFSKYKVIITDRYHGTIFSMIANVPVIVLSSNDHKVKTGLDWFYGKYEGMYFLAQDIESTIELAKNICEKNIVVKNKPYFEKEYYEGLREVVEKI